MMFDHLLNENEEVCKELEAERIERDDIEFIKCLIFPEGDHKYPVTESHQHMLWHY